MSPHWTRARRSLKSKKGLMQLFCQILWHHSYYYFFCFVFVFVFEHNFSAVQSDIRTNSTEHRKPNDSICSVLSSKHEQALAWEAAWFLIDGAGRSHSGSGAVQLVQSSPDRRPRVLLEFLIPKISSFIKKQLGLHSQQPEDQQDQEGSGFRVSPPWPVLSGVRLQVGPAWRTRTTWLTWRWSTLRPPTDLRAEVENSVIQGGIGDTDTRSVC